MAFLFEFFKLLSLYLVASGAMVAIAGAGAGRAAAMTGKEWHLQKLWGAAVMLRVGGVNLCCIFSYWRMLHIAGPGCEVYSKNRFWGFDFWIRCFIFFYWCMLHINALHYK